MRDRALQPDQEMLAPTRMASLRERSDSSVVRAAMDLQRRAGNRSFAELVTRSHADPDQHPLAALSSAGRIPASAGAGGVAAVPSVQREPCIDCPDVAPGPGPAGLEAAAEPGQTG